MSQFKILRKVFEIITDDDYTVDYIQPDLKVDNHNFIILKTTGMSEEFNPSRDVEIFKQTKDHKAMFLTEISYTNLDIEPRIYIHFYFGNFPPKIMDPINIRDYDDTELLLLFGKHYADDTFINKLVYERI